MTCHLSNFLKKITSIPLSLPNPSPKTIKTVLALVLIGYILTGHPAIGAGGLEVEIGDVQGHEIGPNLDKGKQDETEKARLRAVDEKLRKAEEEGRKPDTKGSGTGSGPPTPADTGAGRP